MHLCFVDESGTPPRRTNIGPRKVFVIAGLIMHEAQWHGVAAEVAGLKSKSEFRIRNELKWRYFGAHNDDQDNSVQHVQGR
jgi:hypothetical protein